MSFKAKDLTYDATQPAFLRRLRGEMAGDDSARHERPIPRNKRLKQDDEEDAPTYVLEETNQSLTKAEYEALVSQKESTTEDEGREKTDTVKEVSEKERPKDRITEVGVASKKRKAVKVISTDKDDEEGDPKKQDKPPKKPKKKAKAVKLSFSDDEA